MINWLILYKNPSMWWWMNAWLHFIDLRQVYYIRKVLNEYEYEYGNMNIKMKKETRSQSSKNKVWGDVKIIFSIFNILPFSLSYLIFSCDSSSWNPKVILGWDTCLNHGLEGFILKIDTLRFELSHSIESSPRSLSTMY